LFKGYRYFAVEGYLFFYLISSSEIKITAILPGWMRDA